MSQWSCSIAMSQSTHLLVTTEVGSANRQWLSLECTQDLGVDLKVFLFGRYRIAIHIKKFGSIQTYAAGVDAFQGF